MNLLSTKRVLTRKYLLLFGLIAWCSHAFGQQTVSGVVSSGDGNALVGATVLIKGTTNGVVADINGNFSIESLDPANDVLVISFLGFISQEVPVNGRTTINVTMDEDLTTLGDIVVVGYATKKRTEVTGSIASISADELNVGIISSPEQLFQGKLPGVRVTSTSGEPGAAINVTVRGAGSLISGNSPLYVIDGVPLSNENITPGSANVSGSAVGTTASAKNPLNFLNPDDIASIDVLKDASATAIYGSRGSNGVILITTKKGSAESTNVSYNGYVATSSIANKIDLAGDGSGTDWQDEILRTGMTQNHNLSFSGGSSNAVYRASLSYMEQEGIIKTSELERYTARFNSTIYALPDSRLQVNVNLIGSHVLDYGIPRSDIADTDGELITNTLAADPSRSVIDPATGDYSSGPTNPVGLLESWNDITKTDRILGSLSTSFEITNGLKYQNNIGIDRSSAIREQELLPNNLEGPTFIDGSYSNASIDASNFLIENFLTYDRQTGRNEIGVLLGHAYQRFSVNSYAAQYINYINESLSAIDAPNNASTLVGTPGGGRAINQLESVFGRINYSLDNKLLVTASLRADGSTRFGANNRWGYFSAFSASYQLNEFLPSGLFNDLRARVGWGQTGNQEVPNAASQETFGVNLDGSLFRDQDANPDLKWEQSEQLNIGLEFSIANRRLYGTLDYFNKVNRDFFFRSIAEPPSRGEIWENLDGEIKNSGIELYLGSQIINTGNVTWNLDFNGTFTNNEVVIEDDLLILTGVLSGRSLNGTTVQAIANGQPAGAFFVPTDLGNGEISAEPEFHGSGIPDFVYGINSYLTVGSVDVAMNFSGVSGNEIYNATDNFLANFGGNVSERVADADAIPPGPSSFFLEDGSFLRLNNLTVGYTIPTSDIDWLQNARVYVSGQNLFVITDYTGYDPEVNSAAGLDGNLSYGIDFAAYPRPRTFLLGVNVTF